jgi:hypothetical protein
MDLMLNYNGKYWDRRFFEEDDEFSFEVEFEHLQNIQVEISTGPLSYSEKFSSRTKEMTWNPNGGAVLRTVCFTQGVVP